MQAGSSDMLVAKRESFELSAHDRPVPPPSPTGSRLSRFVGIAQICGALVAVPAGLGSAYTMYKTNFSLEASCQTLRANIVAMLDRSVDAATRRILVRRDVETFEQTCGAVDPDATAAFKVLLAAKTGPAESWEKPAHTTIRRIETAPASKADKVEKVEKVEKIEPAEPVKSEAAVSKTKPAPVRAASVAPVQAGAPVSDAAWVAAVRSALVTPPQHSAAAPAVAAVTAPQTLGELPPPQVLPSAPEAAPALPPPASVSTVSTVAASANPDHPVPPGTIPELQQDTPKKRSRIGEWVGEIPFFGRSLADHVTR